MCLYRLNKQIRLVKEDYHIKKPTDEKFLSEIEDENFMYVGDKVVSFETYDKMINYSSEKVHIGFKYPYAYGEENTYFMFHRKYITIQEYESSTEKDKYQYLCEKDGEIEGDNIENEGIFEFGNIFIHCTLILDKIDFVEKILKINQK